MSATQRAVRSSHQLVTVLSFLARQLLLQIGLRKILILTILAGITLSACSDENTIEAQSSNNNTRAVPVRVTSVQMRPDEEMLRFAGISRVRQRADLTFQVSGVIQDRHIEIGQQVLAGQPLMTLYSPSLQPAFDAARHRLEQLQADRLQANNELERLQTLYDRGVIPLQELEQQSTRLSSLSSAVSNAEATLEQSRSLLQEADLLAPFDGTVEELLLEPGEFVQAGQSVMRIASDNQLEVEIRIPAHLTEGLHIGQQLPVRNSLYNTNDEGVLTASIIEIGRSSTGQSALYPVILTLPESSVRTGEALEVAIPRRTSPALVIPMSAVMRSADGLTVFVSNNNRAQRASVEIEQLQGEFAVVRPGTLMEGMQVIYAGITRLADGDLIEVLP